MAGMWLIAAKPMTLCLVTIMPRRCFLVGRLFGGANRKGLTADQPGRFAQQLLGKPTRLGAPHH